MHARHIVAPKAGVILSLNWFVVTNMYYFCGAVIDMAWVTPLRSSSIFCPNMKQM